MTLLSTRAVLTKIKMDGTVAPRTARIIRHNIHSNTAILKNITYLTTKINQVFIHQKSLLLQKIRVKGL